MKQAVQGVTGLTVNYYVLIDLQGSASSSDAVGGIRVTVRQTVPIGGGDVAGVRRDQSPGTQRLDGFHALWYARSRHGSSDLRADGAPAMRHERDARAARPVDRAAAVPEIAEAGKQVVSTDIPAGELSTFLTLATDGARAEGDERAVRAAADHARRTRTSASSAPGCGRRSTSPSSPPAPRPSRAAKPRPEPAPARRARPSPGGDGRADVGRLRRVAR
jgi:hypothetical protein